MKKWFWLFFLRRALMKQMGCVASVYWQEMMYNKYYGTCSAEQAVCRELQ